MHKRNIRVLVVEDSRVYQEYIKQILNADEQIEVCGVAGTRQQAENMIQNEAPDVITLDLELPDVSGTELLEKLVQEYKIPIVVVTSKDKLCEKAIEIGAKDYIKKMTDNSDRMMEQFTLRLKLKIKMQAINFCEKNTSLPYSLLEKQEKKEIESGDDPRGIILIGASLGGTETTLEILKELPANMPGIVIVQHMTENFTASYAERLNRQCNLRVREARDREQIEPGTVLIAKGGMQLYIYKSSRGYGIRLKKNDGSQPFCPSVDMMFCSAAKVVGDDVTAVILTGMGHDGAKGMKLLHDAGAYTIAESEDTCVVYGMPRAAVEEGGVDIVLPKQKIAAKLMKRYKRA